MQALLVRSGAAAAPTACIRTPPLASLKGRQGVKPWPVSAGGKLRGAPRQRGPPVRGTSWSSIDHFQGVAGLLPSDSAAYFSSAIAIFSVLINAYGSQVLERKRAENAKELANERMEIESKQELSSVLARYRGPLLEATIDFEQKLYHIVSGQDEWGCEEGVSEEELTYTLFVIAQFMGYVEVLRREGPREVSFLGPGNPQGTDTLTCMVEGFRFLFSAVPVRLQEWLDDGEERDHPGSRKRSEKSIEHGCYVPAMSSRDGDLGEAGALYKPLLRLSRGQQRAMGSLMITTSPGEKRQYTLSYYDFVQRLESDASMARWFESLQKDLKVLQGCGDSCTNVLWTWDQERMSCWTRILLLQSYCVDMIDVLDPFYNRLPASRRVRFAKFQYAPVPSLDNYMQQLQNLIGKDPLFSMEEKAK